VKFLPWRPSGESSFVLSGSDDHTLKLWTIGERDGTCNCIQTIEEHTAATNCLATLNSRHRSSNKLVASGAADASIKIWEFESDHLRLLQTIHTTPKYFPLALALSSLDENDQVLVLAAAGTKDTIQIFVANGLDDTLDFKLQATLSGHEGWIRSLDFSFETDNEDSDLLLASASQDKYVRLWRIHQGKELPALTVRGSDPLTGSFLPGKSPSNKAHRLKSGDRDFSITFEALLLCHEDWIYSARWHSQKGGPLQLLSTSADNSLAIWEADPTSGIWVSTVRLGEISREKGATTATGSIGGFWTGLWAPDGRSVATLGRTGSWRRWEFNATQKQWTPCIAVTGHTKAVTGIAWSKDGEYLLSTSLDQTTRLHARWKQNDSNGWHEMSRPQIHGYDLNCIDTIGNNQFVSGADEKLMRVFNKPKAVAKLLDKLRGIADSTGDDSDMPDAANMPVLGLSNKAIEVVDDDEDVQPATEDDREALDPASIVRKSALEIDHPPFEDNLSRHTLWPETEKLYGHGYEISALAVSHDGKVIASSCKASSLTHAVIRLFETETWTEIKPPLTAHTLTATRIRFSVDDKYLLSVGRDRQWAVFRREKFDELTYVPFHDRANAHSRMILDAAWDPRTKSPAFATAGRDKKVHIWGLVKGQAIGDKFGLGPTIKLDSPVTAVDFLGRVSQNYALLAIGTECGKLCISYLNGWSLYVASTFVLQPEYASLALSLPRLPC
jgi:elongator complex protein 2